jgi:hypothetical protein
MTIVSQSLNRKRSLQQLAEELANVSKACQKMGYDRDVFYEFQEPFKVGGAAALVEQRRGPRDPHPNRVRKATDTRTITNPAWPADPRRPMGCQ